MECHLICTQCGKRYGVDEPKLIAVQAEGCAPIAGAFQGKREKVTRFRNPKTIARAIMNPYPPSGN